MKRKLPGIPDFMWEELAVVERRKRMKKLAVILSFLLLGTVGLTAGFFVTILTLGQYVFETMVFSIGMMIVGLIGLVLACIPETHECRKFKNCRKCTK